MELIIAGVVYQDGWYTIETCGTQIGVASAVYDAYQIAWRNTGINAASGGDHHFTIPVKLHQDTDGYHLIQPTREEIEEDSRLLLFTSSVGTLDVNLTDADVKQVWFKERNKTTAFLAAFGPGQRVVFNASDTWYSGDYVFANEEGYIKDWLSMESQH